MQNRRAIVTRATIICSMMQVHGLASLSSVGATFIATSLALEENAEQIMAANARQAPYQICRITCRIQEPIKCTRQTITVRHGTQTMPRGVHGSVYQA